MPVAEAVGVYVGIVASIGTISQLSEIVLEYLRKTAGANEEKNALPLESTRTNIFKELEGKSESARMDEYTRVDAEGGRAFGVVQIGIESGGGQIAAV